MKLLLAFAIALPFSSLAQANDPETILRQKEQVTKEKQRKDDDESKYPFPKDSLGAIKYVEVVNVQNVSAQDLYTRSKLFVAETYKSNKAVTQLNDDEAKIIIIKPSESIAYIDSWRGKQNGYLNYQIKVECKDGRYRYTVDGLGFIATSVSPTFAYLLDMPDSKPPGVSKKNWLKVQEQMDQTIKIIIKVLKSSMAKNPSDF